MGFEPTNRGFAIRGESRLSAQDSGFSESLTALLTALRRCDPGLRRAMRSIVEAWPDLDAVDRRALMTAFDDTKDPVDSSGDPSFALHNPEPKA